VQLVKKFPTFRGSDVSVTCCQESISHPYLSQINTVTLSHPFSQICFLVLSSYLRAGFSSGLFIEAFQYYVYIYFPVRATFPGQFTVLDLMTLTILQRAKDWHVCSFPKSLTFCTFYRINPNVDPLESINSVS
jgi:hypothetical protein